MLPPQAAKYFSQPQIKFFAAKPRISMVKRYLFRKLDFICSKSYIDGLLIAIGKTYQDVYSEVKGGAFIIPPFHDDHFESGWSGGAINEIIRGEGGTIW